MSKILITNAYTWYEKGDAAIILGMMRALRQYIPDANITVLSFTPRVDNRKYKKYEVKFLRNLLPLSPEDNSPKFVKAAKLLPKLIEHWLWLKLRLPINSTENEILNAYADADIVISCGGGFLGGFEIGSLLHVYGIYFAKLLGKPTIIYGQSVEPFGNRLISLATKFVLNRVDLITVREELSLAYLKSLSLKPEVLLTADAGFLIGSISSHESLKLLAGEDIYQSQRSLVGVTVRKWDFLEYSDANLRFTNYLEVLAKTTEWLIYNMKATVVFFPQVIYAPKDDDRVVSSEIASRIGEKQNIRVLTKDYSPEELKGIIGQMDLFIGSRMHSNIFALSMGVPTIAISYRRKTDGIMRMLGMSEYVINIPSLSFDNMVSLIRLAWANRSKIKQQLETKIPEVKNLALHNAEIVKTFLDSTR